MTSALLSALNILTKPLGEASASDAPSQQEALSVALQANRATLLGRLQSDPGLDEVRRLREEVGAEAAWLSLPTEDVVWAFAQECLLLLLTLARHLSTEVELFERSRAPAPARLRTPEAAPPLPPDVLSVTQEKTLAVALQFAVSLGLCPYLVPGVGVALGQRSAFGALVGGLVCRDAPPLAERRLLADRRLLATTRVLLRLAELGSLATLVLTRHLGDILAALCQLGYRPQWPDGGAADREKGVSVEDCTGCREALRSLLGKVYQPMVIKELLILQGRPKQVGPSAPPGRPSTRAAPAWLRCLCGQLLSERLMQPKGVQAVVRAILEEGTGGESDWRKCDGVARILAACPQQSISAESYYRQVCPQILDLLHFRDKLTALQFQHVATRAVLAIVEEKPQFGQQYISDALLGPLQRCILATGECNPEATVEELELTRCIEDVYKIWVVGNSQSVPLLKALDAVLPVVFSLFCFTKQNISHLRAPCREISLWYLGHAEPTQALSALRLLSGLGGQPCGAGPEFHFTLGSEGGAKLSPRKTHSDEEEALFERLSGEQWRLECLVQLLAGLKDSDLPGDFFLELLQELTRWAEEVEEEEEEEEEEEGGNVDLGSMTLLEVEQHLSGCAAGHGQRLSVLQVLAALCEGLPHTVLLRKTTQVVDFMVSLLQRACVALGRAPGSGAENPVESQTLGMGMGLVATLLSEPQLSAEDYTCMSRLLPSLEQLSQKHPDVVFQKLASGLRAVIATHGVYRPENLLPASQRSRGSETVQNRRSETQTLKKDKNEEISSCLAADTSGAGVGTQADTEAGDRQTPQRVPRRNWNAQPMGRDRCSDLQDDPGCPAAKAFPDWLLEACDPDVPTRAVALRALTRMVREKDSEAVHNQEKVLTLFMENLEHEDSFVYLSAVQGLAVLADSFPNRILQRLVGDFRNGPSLLNSHKERSLETRLKVGEVLMRTSRAMGELAPHLGRPLIEAFLQGTRDEDQTVRASCLSNLGELCQRLDYALAPLAQELCSCLTALIKTEKEVEVRRAAVHVIALILRGLCDKATLVLSDVLLDLYRTLKWVVRQDHDQVAVLHAQLALEELDDIMRRFVFPEQKLEKKIVVLP